MRDWKYRSEMRRLHTRNMDERQFELVMRQQRAMALIKWEYGFNNFSNNNKDKNILEVKYD